MIAFQQIQVVESYHVIDIQASLVMVSRNDLDTAPSYLSDCFSRCLQKQNFSDCDHNMWQETRRRIFQERGNKQNCLMIMNLKLDVFWLISLFSRKTKLLQQVQGREERVNFTDKINAGLMKAKQKKYGVLTSDLESTTIPRTVSPAHGTYCEKECSNEIQNVFMINTRKCSQTRI